DQEMLIRLAKMNNRLKARQEAFGFPYTARQLRQLDAKTGGRTARFRRFQGARGPRLSVFSPGSGHANAPMNCAVLLAWLNMSQSVYHIPEPGKASEFRRLRAYRAAASLFIEGQAADKDGRQRCRYTVIPLISPRTPDARTASPALLGILRVLSYNTPDRKNPWLTNIIHRINKH
ncbi:MAG: hypothetical protein ACRYHA_34960, partial [Janthinobacterium lividum]